MNHSDFPSYNNGSHKNHKSNSFLQKLKFIISPSDRFLRHKYKTHREFTFVVSIFLALLCSVLWVWDFIIDEVGSSNTIGLRITFLGMVLFSFLFVYVKKYTLWMPLLVISGMLVAEMNFILILNRLQGGMELGISGFMYCMFNSILLLQCFSFRINVVYTILAVFMPHLAGFFNVANNFPHLHYAAVMWPTAILIILVQMVQSYHYLMRFQLENQLEKLSGTDALTGAKNRRYFLPLLEKKLLEAQRQQENISLLMMDIDFFKKINDCYGHLTGDLVIKSFVEMCFHIIKPTDVIVRMGGEEFAILLPDCNQPQAQMVAERIRTSTAQMNIHSSENKTFNFTVSIGVAQFRHRETEDVQSFIGRADSALYIAKNSGRNIVALAP